MKFTSEAQEKINAYLQFLRQILIEQGRPELEINALPDEAILSCFNKCHCCEAPLFSSQQQLRAVLEFDTPQKAFQILCESLEQLPHLPSEEEQSSCDEECFMCEAEEDDEDYSECDNEEFCETCQALENDDEDECVDDYCIICDDVLDDEEDIQNKMCPPCFEEVMHIELAEDREEQKVVRGRWVLEGATNLDEAITKVADFLDTLQKMKSDGYELAEPVSDDYGFLEQINKQIEEQQS